MEIQSLIFLYVVIIFSAVIHEYFHGWMADRLGDPTAKLAGRLTLNPLKHMDLWGTVILPLFLMTFFNMFIGYAKPVPYNPYNIRNKYGVLLVGIAGPASNMLIAIILGLIVRFFLAATLLGPFISFIVYINIFLALFNMIPVPPLDGSKVASYFLPRQYNSVLQQSFFGIFFAIMIAVWFLPAVASFIHTLITGQSLFV